MAQSPCLCGSVSLCKIGEYCHAASGACSKAPNSILAFSCVPGVREIHEGLPAPRPLHGYGRGIIDGDANAAATADRNSKAAAVDVYVHAYGSEGSPDRTIRCTNNDKDVLAFESGQDVVTVVVPPGAGGAGSDGGNGNSGDSARNKRLVARVFGVPDRNNNEDAMHSRRTGSLTCVDESSSGNEGGGAGGDANDANDGGDGTAVAETFTLDVTNVRFPAYSHGSIHRGIDNAVVNIFSLEYLITVGNQNVTFFQQDATWIGPMFSPSGVTLHFRLPGDDSALAAAALLTRRPTRISDDGRSATFLLPPFEAVCQSSDNDKDDDDNGEAKKKKKKTALLSQVDCPARIQTAMIDSKTGGLYRSTIYYTEKCASTKAWPDPMVEWRTCQSFDPDVAVLCAFGHAKTCRNCPRHARCPGGDRAWPMVGYWNADETSVDVVRCAIPAEERCLGFDVKNLTCRCGLGYAGTACRDCAPGYFTDRDRRCAPCPEQLGWYDLVVLPSMILAGVLVCVIASLTTLTLVVSLIGIRSLAPAKQASGICRGGHVLSRLKLALHNSFLFAVGLVGVLQIVASVVRPVPSKAPKWYAATVSILDVVFLDTGGVINQECLDGDALSNERRILVGTLLCLTLAVAFQGKQLRPENWCCCWGSGCDGGGECAATLRLQVTPRIRMILFYALSLIYGVAASVSLSLVTCTSPPLPTSSAGSAAAATTAAPPPDTTLRLRSRPGIECYSAADGTQTLAVLACILLAVFVVPWPLASFWFVRRYYWSERRGRGTNEASWKDTVYDYWIAADNNMRPEFFWFRSLDAALLGLTAAFAAMFDVPDNFKSQVALATMTCMLFTAYMVLLKRKNPFAETRQWVRPFRYASLGTGCLASVLRCVASSSVSAVSQASIDALAAAVVVLLVLALTAAIVAFERGMLIQARDSARVVLSRSLSAGDCSRA